jgi:predicted amidohydrolase
LMKISLVQFNAGPDKHDNIRRALLFVEDAASRGAKFILLPEVFHYRGDLRKPSNFNETAETIPGVSLRPFMELASKKRVFILAGSVIERAERAQKAYNTSVLIDTKGWIQAKYRKIHLFDAQIKTTSLKESKIFNSGTKPTLGKVGEFSLGMSVCYDLRFPDLYQAYRGSGAHMLSVPSCFTKTTGRAHWEVLLRARAIETQTYVLAPNQVGKDARGIASYGNSMVVGPWGEILVRGSANREEILFADISLRDIKKSQKTLPGFRKTV